MRHHTCNHITPRPASNGRRMGALWLCGLVVLLGLLGASPTLHAGLHEHDEDHAATVHDDSGCVVWLYTQGVTSPAPALTVAPPPEVDHASTFYSPADPLLAVIPHLHPAGRAPPAPNTLSLIK